MTADHADDYRTVPPLACDFCGSPPTHLVIEKDTGEEMQTCETHIWKAFS